MLVKIRRCALRMRHVTYYLTLAVLLFTAAWNFWPTDTAYTRDSRLSSAAKKSVLLLSYGRSGTSFTSGVIGFHPEVFYVFEPLHSLEFYRFNKKYFINPYERQSKEILESVFSCDFLTHNISVLNDTQIMNSNSTIDFYHCMQEKASGFSHLTCLNDLLLSCKKHPMILVKTIRFPVRWTEQLLRESPNFKLLVLFRDPRATLRSQSVVFKHYNWTRDVVNISRQHCQRLQEDIQESDRLKRLYSDRVKCIRYEDGATDPYSYFRDIYKFLGLDLNKGVIDYIRRLTTGENYLSSNWYSIQRNSVEAMSKWRARADFEKVRRVDELCGHLYPILGYRMVESPQDLVSNRSLVTAPRKGGLF